MLDRSVRNAVRLAVGGLTVVCSLVAGPAAAQGAGNSTSSATGSSAPAGHAHGAMGSMPHDASPMHRSTMGSMQQMQSMPPSGNADRDFAMMMREHHRGAIDMARAELEHGKDPKMREMAKKIIAAQQKEIREFDRWLERSPDRGAAREGKR